MDMYRNFLRLFSNMGIHKISTRTAHALAYLAIGFICFGLITCALHPQGIGQLSTEWFVSVAKDGNSPGGSGDLQKINGSKVQVREMLFGDFDGDKKTDVFTTWGGKWRISDAKNSASLGGTSTWKIINTSDVPFADIRLGDFDGDGKTDVFTSSGGEWRISTAIDGSSPGGTSKWKVINSSGVEVSDILIGDFDGDSKADVFTTGGGKWRISVAKDKASPGATSPWQEINTSEVDLDEILIGDFDGDGKSDVFTNAKAIWRVSIAKDKSLPGGTSPWKQINTSFVEFSDLRLGDFDRDRKTDVFTTWSGKWRISTAKDSNSFGATSQWQVINTSDVDVGLILIGDFDADRKADVFTAQ
jgi:FG-GAP-like repeat